MDFVSIIEEAQRKIRNLEQTGAAEALEHNHEVTVANERAASFVRNVIQPLLKSAEDDLRAAGFIAMTTETFSDKCSRCMLSAGIDEDTGPSCLAFEACTGNTTPRVLWTSGEAPVAITDMDPAAVRQ